LQKRIDALQAELERTAEVIHEEPGLKKTVATEVSRTPPSKWIYFPSRKSNESQASQEAGKKIWLVVAIRMAVSVNAASAIRFGSYCGGKTSSRKMAVSDDAWRPKRWERSGT